VDADLGGLQNSTGFTQIGIEKRRTMATT